MSLLQERADNVLREVEEHAFSDTRREVGGVLVGTLDEDGAHVQVALPALKAVGGQTNVTFTHEVWEEVLQVVDRDHAGQRIVGWYHTHPGFGLFLSDYDKFIHRNFFAEPRMVALVVDPLAGELGWFGWDGDDVVLVERHRTARDGLRKAGLDGSGHLAANTQRHRPRALLALPAVALLGAIGGYALGMHTVDAAARHQSERLAAAEAQTRAARHDADQLHQQLAAAKAVKSTPAATAPQIHSIRYRVQRGDTLWRVAEALYGDGGAYRRIAEANPQVRAGHLFQGQTLTVPMPNTAGG